MYGQITRWNAIRGYGFVTTLEDGFPQQHFFHISQFLDTHISKPVVGAYVTFTLGAGISPDRKSQATQVRYAKARNAVRAGA